MHRLLCRIFGHDVDVNDIQPPGVSFVTDEHGRYMTRDSYFECRRCGERWYLRAGQSFTIEGA